MTEAIIFDLDSCLAAANEVGDEVFAPAFAAIRAANRGTVPEAALRDIVRSFVGFEYVWEVELLIRSQAAPQTRLGDGTQLGWSSWMAGASPNAPKSRPVTGMVFEPESYSV